MEDKELPAFIDAGHAQEEHKQEEHKHHAATGSHESMINDFRKRSLITFALTLGVLLISPTVHGWFGISFFTNKYILFALSTAIVLYGGYPFFSGALESLKMQRAGMDFLVSIAVLSGYLYSAASTFIFQSADFYWEISTLVLFLLIGHYIEMRSVAGATDATSKLEKLLPDEANLVKGEEIITVSTLSLSVGDIVLVKPGGRIPLDGVIEEGEAHIDESLITGESRPVSRIKGDAVIGGSISTDSAVRVKITKLGDESTVSRIMDLVRKTQEEKPHIQKLADRAAEWLTIIAIAAGLVTFLVWSSQGILFAITAAITVIVIACPHALGLAIPTVIAISTTLAARSGILIKELDAIESARNAKVVVFDKTGTLTTGEFSVTEVLGDKDTLRLAAAAESFSEHVIAKAIVRKAGTRLKATDFRAFPGRGVMAKIDKKEIYVGSPAFISGITKDNPYKDDLDKHAFGNTIVLVATKKKVIGLIILSDVIREGSKEAVALLKGMGKEVAMLTGDNEVTAAHVAVKLGIDFYYAEMLPEDKVRRIKEMQDLGGVIMVGDGINDAPALVAADVGIAAGAGTDIAISSAQVILVSNDPVDVARFLKLSSMTASKMKQNLVWATAYNAVAIPVAAGVFHPFFIRPEIGALAMAASTVIVVINALLLKKAYEVKE